MKRFIDWLLRRKPEVRKVGNRPRTSESEQIKSTRAAMQAVTIGDGPAAGRLPRLDGAAPEVLTRTANSATVAKNGPQPAANIWDIDAPAAAAPVAPVRPQAARDAAQSAPPPVAEPPAPPAAAAEPAEAAAPAASGRRKSSRTKTRVLGFEPQPAAVVPLFDEGRMDDDGDVRGKANMVMFPVGWLAVTAGPGKGAVFGLSKGLSQIGRGTDQTVALDFGDMAISRQNHASIAYDGATHRFHVGHGGKSNLVRLNGKPLLSTELLSDGDEIQIGETTLMLKVLCTPAFNWSAAEAGGDGHDMAIA